MSIIKTFQSMDSLSLNSVMYMSNFVFLWKKCDLIELIELIFMMQKT